jgi:hypothetical protein
MGDEVLGDKQADDDMPDSGPRGVWVEYHDGARFDDLPVIPAGPDEAGVEVYDLLLPRDEAIARMGLAVLPAQTSVRFKVVKSA